MVDKDVTKGNYFPELKLAVEKKLESLDPNAILKGSDVKAPPVDPKALKEAQDEMNKFLSEVNSKTNKAGLDNKNAIFEDTPKQVQVSEAERTRSQAEKEKNKGNECMKAKEYDQAIEHYQKAISVDPSFHVVFGNMSQAYLNLKSKSNLMKNTRTQFSIVTNLLKSILLSQKVTTEDQKPIREWVIGLKLLKIFAELSFLSLRIQRFNQS
jgi:tetratricopeptide (TPR) repeat protein